MNFERKIQSAINAAEEATKKANALMDEYAELKDFTAIFLACCESHGIKTVSINTYTKLIEACKGWSYADGSVFADERDGTWPAIWAVCSEMDVGGGCGNSGQHQLKYNARLIDGVYRLENGNWTKLGEEDA